MINPPNLNFEIVEAELIVQESPVHQNHGSVKAMTTWDTRQEYICNTDSSKGN